MNWRQAVPTSVTILAMLAGFMSILVMIQGMIYPPEPPEDVNIWFCRAAKLIMLAMILDGIDGNLARWLKGQSDFGAELDTYVDLTAFGIAPAILIFAVTLQTQDMVLRVLLPSAVALSGMVRLARFKVKDPLRGQAGYAGLPITANAGWVAMFVYVSQSPPKENFSLTHGLVATLFLVGVILFTVLQVTNFRYPKPTKKAVLFIPCVILVALLFWPVKKVSVAAATIMLVLGAVYIFVGPLFVKGMDARKARHNGNNHEAPTT